MGNVRPSRRDPRDVATLEYFPTVAHEDAYYDGLAAADAGDPAGRRAFYLERLLAMFDAT